MAPAPIAEDSGQQNAHGKSEQYPKNAVCGVGPVYADITIADAQQDQEIKRSTYCTKARKQTRPHPADHDGEDDVYQQFAKQRPCRTVEGKERFRYRRW